MQYILEIVAFNLQSAILAAESGADRIEICGNIADGGTTPSFGDLKMAREKIQISLFSMVRPRGGDFLYNDEEFEAMKSDTEICKNLGYDGIVTGMLSKNGTVDKIKLKEIVKMAVPMQVTFHRAFDRTRNPLEALEDIIECGCKRILTSGQHQFAINGIEIISELNTKANDRIIIIPGGGISAKNIKEIALNTGAKEIHSPAKVILPSKMEGKFGYINEEG